MKFPLRLSLDLLSSRITGALAGGRDASTIFHLSASAFSATNQKESEADSDPNAAVMEIPASVVGQTAAPTFWLGVAGPFLAPGIVPVACRLHNAKRHSCRS